MLSYLVEARQGNGIQNRKPPVLSVSVLLLSLVNFFHRLSISCVMILIRHHSFVIPWAYYYDVIIL